MAKKEFVVVNVPVFRFFNLRANCAEKAESLVTFKVLSAQYDGLARKLPIEDFEKAHAGADFWTAPIGDFEGVVPADDLGEMLEIRGNALKVKRAIDALPYGLDAFNALSDADKRFILIEAHKTAPSVTIPTGLMKDADLAPVIKKAYTGGSTKQAGEAFRSLFFKVCGEGGELFYGVSLNRAALKTFDVMNVLASFGGRAKRAEKKDKDGNVTIKNYDWILKDNSKKAQASAITTLCGVILESRKGDYCKVIEG